MRKARVCAFMLLALGLLVLSGCWGSRETDEVAYVLAMGFDKGEKENLVVTVMIANPKVIAGISGGGGGGGGGEGGGGGGTLIYSVESYAPLASIDLLNTVIDRRVSFLHTKAFLFSEELAREGLAKWIYPLNRYRELRGTAQIFICRGKAKDFIEKNNPPLELSPTKQIELLNLMSRETGLYHSTQLSEFYDDTKSESIQPSIPLVALHEGGLESAKPGIGRGGAATPGKYVAGEVPIAGANKAQVIGSAVFKGDKMVGILNGQETRYYLVLRGLIKSGITGMPDPSDPNTPVGLQVRQARPPKYTTSIDPEGNVTIDVDIYNEPEIISIASGCNYEDPANKTLLEEYYSRQLQEGLHDLIRRTQEEFGTDIFGFGKQVKRKFWTVPSWREFQWLNRYPEASINVTVHSKIRRTGLQLETKPAAGVE
ncbi:Spore germination protein A3 precursor [Pelotomaculum sp. FP]|uniref:Ger(x)C family spore germination protein n=1 Tax=Pelotomaculum sp. FP TaxID=261474 RepID=UPI001064D6AE|nr:Ger(x)C family spore germination protein [Pelotomaculum sp. FP]TEB14311.1 Spore germination protein A3 precursor [Pelotomaculum sp. FP]